MKTSRPYVSTTKMNVNGTWSVSQGENAKIAKWKKFSTP